MDPQDPPEYFDRAGGFLTYTADVPAKMLAAAVPKQLPLLRNGTLGHFRLIHHQLLQMRNAWAIAQVPILPRFHCSLSSGLVPGVSGARPSKLPLLSITRDLR